MVGDHHNVFTWLHFSPADMIIDLLSGEQMLLPRSGEHGSVFASVIAGAKNGKALIEEKFSRSWDLLCCPISSWAGEIAEEL